MNKKKMIAAMLVAVFSVPAGLAFSADAAVPTQQQKAKTMPALNPEGEKANQERVDLMNDKWSGPAIEPIKPRKSGTSTVVNPDGSITSVIDDSRMGPKTVKPKPPISDPPPFVDPVKPIPTPKSGTSTVVNPDGSITSVIDDSGMGPKIFAVDKK